MKKKNPSVQHCINQGQRNLLKQANTFTKVAGNGKAKTLEQQSALKKKNFSQWPSSSNCSKYHGLQEMVY